MPKETDNIDVVQTKTLSQKVSQIRLKARDILRMYKINDLVAQRYHLEGVTTEAKKGKEIAEKQLAIAQYELTKLDTEHPNYETNKKNAEKTVKTHEENLEYATKELEKETAFVEKRTAEIDEAIAKWESGENKVSIDELNSLAYEMIKKA